MTKQRLAELLVALKPKIPPGHYLYLEWPGGCFKCYCAGWTSTGKPNYLIGLEQFPLSITWYTSVLRVNREMILAKVKEILIIMPEEGISQLKKFVLSEAWGDD